MNLDELMSSFEDDLTALLDKYGLKLKIEEYENDRNSLSYVLVRDDGLSFDIEGAIESAAFPERMVR